MNEMDRGRGDDNPPKWETEAAFEQQPMTVEEQMDHYFPSMITAEIAGANPFDLLMKIALKRCDEGESEEDNETSWDIMEAIWDRAHEMVEEEEMMDEQLES